MVSKFMFFENFKDTADKLPDDLRLKFYDAITDYAFKGIEPDDAIIGALVNAIKPSLDKEEKRGGNHNPSGNNQHKVGQTGSNEVKRGQTEVKVEVKNNQGGQSGQSFLETETETETETEDIVNLAASRQYAFEGQVVKLSQKDFDNWQRAYPELNLRAELMMRDQWLARQPEDVRKRWFISTQQYFLKQNEFRKRQNHEEVREDWYV